MNLDVQDRLFEKFASVHLLFVFAVSKILPKKTRFFSWKPFLFTQKNFDSQEKPTGSLQAGNMGLQNTSIKILVSNYSPEATQNFFFLGLM